MIKRDFIKGLIVIFIFLVMLTGISGCRLFFERGPDDLILYRVKITRVIDGDTVYALFPDGNEEKVRLIGIDAPEINHPTKGLEAFGPEAEAYTRGRLKGETIWLEFDLGERDQYGRLLAYLWLAVPEEITDSEIRLKMFNAILLLEGYADQVIFEPNIKYADYFSVYEAEARESGKGLWGLDQ